MLTRARRRHCEKQKIDRVGKWKPPSYGVLKINTDGSSRGNLGPAGIGGIGRDAMGSLIFIFSIYDRIQTINLVEGLVILATLEKAHALGLRRIVCESNSQVLINMLNEQKVADVNWQLARIVQQILQISSLMEMVFISEGSGIGLLTVWQSGLLRMLRDGELRSGS